MPTFFDRFLLAFGGGADNHQQTPRAVFEPGIGVDGHRPKRNHTAWQTVALAPAGVFVYLASFRRAMIEVGYPFTPSPTSAHNSQTP
jgi:hypothetical protein